MYIGTYVVRYGNVVNDGSVGLEEVITKHDDSLRNDGHTPGPVEIRMDDVPAGKFGTVYGWVITPSVQHPGVKRTTWVQVELPPPTGCTNSSWSRQRCDDAMATLRELEYARTCIQQAEADRRRDLVLRAYVEGKLLMRNPAGRIEAIKP